MQNIVSPGAQQRLDVGARTFSGDSPSTSTSSSVYHQILTPRAAAAAAAQAAAQSSLISSGMSNGSTQHQVLTLDKDKSSTHNKVATAQRDVLLAGTAYILSSAGLILFNKHALSSFNFQCPNCLLFFHCLLAVVLVKTFEVLGWSHQPVEPLKWRIVQLWMPVNLIFVGMIASSFLALRLVGVGMFTVLKNLSNLLAIGGDYFFFGRTYPMTVWMCVGLMLVSAAAGGVTDMHFNLVGYAWQLINCVFTSAYALYLSHVMTLVQPHTHDGKRMGELSMVYYNNLLSLGPIAVLALWFGEVPRLRHQEALLNPEFLIVAVVGGLLGFLISFASLWFMSRSSATVFSLTGSMNKVIVALAGIILFQEPTTAGNLASIAVGLGAGTLFVMAKAYVVKS